MSKHSRAVLFMPDGSEIDLPAKWIICSHCEGAGKSSSYLGAYTSDEWNELDDDFHADYLAGHYDRACEYCDGLGRVLVADRSKMSKDQRREHDEQLAELAACDRIERQERERGA